MIGTTRMPRALLIAWLTLPFLVVGSLWLFVDRSKGRPDPALVRAAASTGASTLGARAGAEQPGGVQPESLAQGFVLLVDDPSKVASASSPIYLASNHNGWNPGDPKQRLTQRSDGKWQVVLSKPKLDSRLAFKFTRGSWETVEVGADLKDIENRMLPLLDARTIREGEAAVIELTVEGWRDQRAWEPAALALNRYRDIRVGAGTLKRLEVVGGGVDGPARVRDALVWLPPGYDDPANADRRYPVLYLQDGQNVFEQLPGVPGEWQADETAARLIGEGKIRPLIIVAVPHAGPARMQEYVPFPMFEGVPARGSEYVDFLVREVKARVDRAFRTLTGAADTCVGGASLGGLISLYAGSERPDVFGMVLAESVPMLSHERAVLRFFGERPSWPGRVYFGMGAKEGGSDPADAKLNEAYVEGARAFERLLESRLPGKSSLLAVIDPVGHHDEMAWARRLEGALRFLFSADPLR